MKDSKPEEKSFSLKDIELRMIGLMQAQANQSMGDFLSFLAIERLAYPVTPLTQFKIEDGKLIISEAEPEVADEKKEEVSVA